MAKISTYPQPTPPSLSDYVIGTDISDGLATKNFLLSDIISLTGSSVYVPYTGATTNVVLGTNSLSGFDIIATNSLNTNGPLRVSSNAGTSGQILTSSGSSSAPSWQNNYYAYGLFAQTTKSGIVTFSTGEQSLIGTGVGTLTVPPNGFKVGDSFALKLCGPISSGNNQGLRITVKTNAIILIDTGTITMPSTTSKTFELILDFTVTKLGINGIAEIFANGLFSYNKDASNAIDGINIGLINNTTFNTEIANSLGITAQWIGTNPLNAIQSQNLTLTKIY